MVLYFFITFSSHLAISLYDHTAPCPIQVRRGPNRGPQRPGRLILTFQSISVECNLQGFIWHFGSLNVRTADRMMGMFTGPFSD